MVLHLTDDNAELQRLPERNQIFRLPLGLPLTPPTRPSPTPAPPTGVIIMRTVPGPGNLTYGEVTRVATLPEGDVQDLVATAVCCSVATLHKFWAYIYSAWAYISFCSQASGTMNAHGG